MKKTALHSRHLSLGARMFHFSGWEMPLYYTGILQEHQTVRRQVGLFDLSHMGRILVEGSEAEKFLDFLSTNSIQGKKDGTATYTLWCQENGGCVDDVIVYKRDQNHFFVIVNASNRDKDLAHLINLSHPYQVKILPQYADGILALQGPKALLLLTQIFPQKEIETLKAMHFITVPYENEEIILSATGYTGAGGFEIYGSSEKIISLWDLLLLEGQSLNIQPVGLGARDTLRLEKGYALYGHELSEDILANETVSAWTIKWGKSAFLGKDALISRENSSKKRIEYGIIMMGPGIAREGFPVFKQGKPIGEVTSGSFSPSLNQAIAIILVQEKLTVNEVIDVQIREKYVQAKVVELPFL